MKKLKPFKLIANLGTTSSPFFIEKELGEFSNPSEASYHAQHLLDPCKLVINWALFEGDQNTGYIVKSSPVPDQGCAYQIIIYADTEDDAKLALSEVSKKLDCVEGFDQNETGYYEFVRTGEFISEDTEYDNTNVIKLRSFKNKDN